MLLALLNIQVYVIIKYPIKSRLMINGKKVVASCLVVWVLATGMGFMNVSYIWLKNNRPYYTYIGYVACLEIAVFIQIVLKILITVQMLSSRHRALKGENQKQKQVAKTVMLLNLIQIFTALPYFLALQIEWAVQLQSSGDNSFLTNFSYYYEPVALLNFVLNPIMYSLRLNDYRRSAIALFTCDCKKQATRKSSSLLTQNAGTTDGDQRTGSLDVSETKL